MSKPDYGKPGDPVHFDEHASNFGADRLYVHPGSPVDWMKHTASFGSTPYYAKPGGRSGLLTNAANFGGEGTSTSVKVVGGVIAAAVIGAIVWKVTGGKKRAGRR